MLITRANTFDEIHRTFTWRLPERMNIASLVCDRHAARAPDRIALLHEQGNGRVATFTFGAVQRLANQCAHTLERHLGLQRGDRVMIYLGQDPATAVAHVACWKAGLVSVPTSVLFGTDALEYRLRDSGAKVLITDAAHLATVAAVRERVGDLQAVLLTDSDAEGTLPFWETIARASDAYDTLALTPDTPAFINYTSGTTGRPKGALQGHRSILGHMPGNEMMYDFMPQPGDVMWSPADWSWLAGLMDVLMPAWFCGLPVLTYRNSTFDPEEAFRLMGKHRVTASLLTPTMLRRMVPVRDPVQRFGLQLRAVASGGESVGRETLEWADRTLRVRVNEVYGQTECNLVLGNCWQVLAPKPGSLGRAMPGHVAAIVDDEGRELAPGEIGQIAFRRPDPVMMLEYWRNPQATAKKFAGDWLLTGDLGRRDDDGYFWYQSRADDVITCAGYRIGPGEIEDALNGHPAVAMSAVVGVPDPVTTESIRAYLVLRPGFVGDAALRDAIRESVRTRLARHESPRTIEFVDSLPMTATGKIMRRELRERARRGD
ncbi:MAG TPA: AMP-binding protein [Burkholderiaceae bacterium]|nr:AMP-binding protein [Burkholderiaceae bacterium]